MPKEGVCDVNHEYRVADYLRDVGALSVAFIILAPACLPMHAFLGGFWRMLRFLFK
jgi:hypothetical protein